MGCDSQFAVQSCECTSRSVRQRCSDHPNGIKTTGVFHFELPHCSFGRQDLKTLFVTAICCSYAMILSMTPANDHVPNARFVTSPVQQSTDISCCCQTAVHTCDPLQHTSDRLSNNFVCMSRASMQLGMLYGGLDAVNCYESHATAMRSSRECHCLLEH